MCPVKREINYSRLWFSFAPKVSNFAPIRRPKLNPVTVPAQTQELSPNSGAFLGFPLFFFPAGRSLFHKRKYQSYTRFNLGIIGVITVASWRFEASTGALQYGEMAVLSSRRAPRGSRTERHS